MVRRLLIGSPGDLTVSQMYRRNRDAVMRYIGGAIHYIVKFSGNITSNFLSYINALILLLYL